MREKLQRFMIGRYGVDMLSKGLLVVAFITMLGSALIAKNFLYGISLFLVVICYLRMFSKNIEKRYQENLIFMKYVNRVTGFLNKKKQMWKMRKQYHIYTCSKCKQKIRIPRGKGKIMITCPKCRHEFVKKV